MGIRCGGGTIVARARVRLLNTWVLDTFDFRDNNAAGVTSGPGRVADVGVRHGAGIDGP